MLKFVETNLSALTLGSSRTNLHEPKSEEGLFNCVNSLYMYIRRAHLLSGGIQDVQHTRAAIDLHRFSVRILQQPSPRRHIQQKAMLMIPSLSLHPNSKKHAAQARGRHVAEEKRNHHPGSACIGIFTAHGHDLRSAWLKYFDVFLRI